MGIRPSNPTRSSRAIPIVLVAALVVAALFLFWSLRGDQEPGRVQEAIDLAEPLATEDDHAVSVQVASPELRSEIEVSGTEPIAAIEPATAEEGASTVSVLIRVDGLPWLAEGEAGGTLRWSGGSGDKPLRFTLEPRGAALTATLELRSAPSSREEFTNISVAGLSLHALALRSLEPNDPQEPGAHEFELLLEWAQGPSLVWAESVPQDERSLVNVALGGDGEPRSRDGRYGPRKGLVQVRPGLELPLRLPKLKREEAVWVGAAGRVWRSFAAPPDAARIEVVLSAASSIRVLHDVPLGGVPDYVRVRALPWGDSDVKPVASSGVVDFTERPALVHEVWVASSKELYGSKRLSRLVRVPLAVGEMGVVDLRSDSVSGEFGSLRVRVLAYPETVKQLKKGSLGEELGLSISRRGLEGSTRPWERVGHFVAVEGDSSDAQIYEMTGLEPGLHRVIVRPTGHSFMDDVVAGEQHVVDVSLDDLGWIQLVLPDGSPPSAVMADLMTADPVKGERAYLRFGSGFNGVLDAARPTAAGRYFVQTTSLPIEDTPSLVSDEFVVQAGETTKVVLRERSLVTVELVAQDAATGEPVGLGRTFWREVSAVGVQTGLQHRGSITFVGGTPGSTTRVTWKLDEVDEPVEIRVPENPFWEFGKVEPLRLEDGTKIVLRATRKDG